LIPKIIHYCWFGPSDKPKYFYRCKKSWIKFFPDFEIIEWNETNTDFAHPFLKEAFRQKKWAFVSDLIRIQKLVDQGGIYLDTDMLFLKPFDLKLLDFKFLIGMENSKSLSAGVIGSEKNGIFLNQVLGFYSDLKVFQFENLIIPSVLNSIFQKYSTEKLVPGKVNEGLILPFPVFYPLPFKLKNYHWEKFVTQETLAVHLWAGSWLDPNNNNFSQFLMFLNLF